MAQRPMYLGRLWLCRHSSVQPQSQVTCPATKLGAHQSTNSTATAGLCCLCLANQLACSHA